MKIVIVGGGTAGWLAALTIARAQPGQHNIKLVESQRIGIIGAGEGSTQLFYDYINNTWFDTGINLNEFIQAANATPKIGIKHVNWRGDNTAYFAPLDGTSTSSLAPDIEFCKQFLSDPSKVYLASRLGRCFEEKTISGWTSFHFDAFKVGEYLKSIAVASGVECIDDEVFGVKTENDTITSIQCVSNRVIDGDFFIDCTGFKRCLAGALDVKWHSYKRHLPVDSALGFQLPLTENFDPITTAAAMSAGWAWRIPTSERFGCGYVYSSAHISDQQAEHEVLARFGNDVKILRKFKFESGRSEVLWRSNCLNLGLAAAFAEPLEATSIHTTIMQIMVFVMENLRSTQEQTCVQIKIDRYNQHMAKMYDDFRDFLIIHYMGGRVDSEFWRYMTNGECLTDKSRYILELCETSVPSSLSIDHYFGCAGSMLYNWVLAGIGRITTENVQSTLASYNK